MTAIIVTLIICVTLVSLASINAIAENKTNKRAARQLDETLLKLFENKED